MIPLAVFLPGGLLAQTDPDQLAEHYIRQLGIQQPGVLNCAAPAAINAVPALIRMLQDDGDANTRETAAWALGCMGPAATNAVPALIKLLQHNKDSKAREAAAWALANIGPAAKDVPALVKVLQEQKDSAVRKAVVGALDGIGPAAKDAVPTLVNLLQDDKDPAVTQYAAALGNIGLAAKDAVPALTKALREDTDYLDGYTVAQALERIANASQDAGAVDSIPALKEAQEVLEKAGFGTPSAAVRRAVQKLERDRDEKLSTRLQNLLAWVKANPGSVVWPSLSVVYLVWFLVLQFALLPRIPLALLRWNENLVTLDFKLPTWLGEATVPFRKVVLIGFYHYRPRVLEAWVSSHVPRATEMLQSLPAVRDRTTYVPLPVRLNGTKLAELKPEHLQATCAANLWRVLLKGEGGLGKTTLALRIAQWALAGNPAERLCRDRQMLPVLLDSEIKFNVRKDLATFKNVVRAHLRELITQKAPIPEGLFEKLLADRRILIILDGLSEMPASPPEPGIANPQNPDFPANALLITSRDEEREFAPKLTIEPQRIDTNHLLPFINAYLTEAGQNALTDSELFDASRRLAELVTMETGITPLLARLFAEQLVDLQKHAKPISDLPRTVPDLMLSYLNSLNRDRAPDDPENADVHKAAKIAAWESLKETFKPGQPGAKDTIRKALADAQLSDTLLDTLETRLKVVKTVEPAESHVQFLLDPLTEYLAALQVVEERAGDEERWREFLKEVDGKSGAPGSIRGFLAAVRDCCLARPSLHVPVWVPDELVVRIGLDPEAANAARRKHRIQQLIRSLDESPYAADRLHAAKQLGELGPSARDAVPALTKSLHEDKDADVRAAVAETIGRIGPAAEGAFLAFARTLREDQDMGARCAAVRALGHIGADAKDTVPVLAAAPERQGRPCWRSRSRGPGPHRPRGSRCRSRPHHGAPAKRTSVHSWCRRPSPAQHWTRRPGSCSRPHQVTTRRQGRGRSRRRCRSPGEHWTCPARRRARPHRGVAG
ncbi:MAG: HEAT repeat domain-containing protein [Bryobacteraceae bacterium]